MFGNIEVMTKKFMKDYQSPGFLIQIDKGGESVYTHYHGFSDLEKNKPMNKKSVHSIMSLTKSFTALSLLHLEENSSFCLDAPITDYLPYFKTKSGFYHKMTTQHILSHSAGFPSNIWLVTLLDHGLYQFAKNLPEYQYIFKEHPNLEEELSKMKSREDISKYFAQIDLLYEPGKGWQYCTDAYVIAADIIEKVSGLIWEEYVAKHIFEPCKMTHTYINPSKKNSDQIVEYYINYQQNYLKIPTPHNKLGASVGFIFSTAQDMSRYLQTFMQEEPKVLSVQARKKLFTSYANRENGLGYGLGWKIKHLKGLQVFEHAGGYPGVSSFASMLPEKKVSLVIFANLADIPLQSLSDQILLDCFS